MRLRGGMAHAKLSDTAEMENPLAVERPRETVVASKIEESSRKSLVSEEKGEDRLKKECVHHNTCVEGKRDT